MTMSDQELPTLDAWRQRDVHWHCYVTHADVARSPHFGAVPEDIEHEALATPDEVASWIERVIRDAAGADPATDYSDSVDVWRSTAARAQSLSSGLRNILTVTAEIITSDQCTCLPRQGRVVSALRGRRG